MGAKSKSKLWIIITSLILFIISTAILLGLFIFKQRENGYHKKYIKLLAAIQYYDGYSVNEIRSLISGLKKSDYYNKYVAYTRSIGNSAVQRSVFPSVKEIEDTINEVELCKYKTKWALNKQERFDSFLTILRIDNYDWISFTEEFYNGNAFSDGINLFKSLGNIEWSDHNGNKLMFIAAEPVQHETGNISWIGADCLEIELNGRRIVSWKEQTSIKVSNILAGDSILIQCNKDTSADNFRITSLEYGGIAWWLTIEEIVSDDEINKYELYAQFE